MLESIIGSNLTIENLLICSITAIVLGLLIAITHKMTSKYNKNFLVTLTIIPLIVEIIMIMVNGSLGTGIAVAGAFSLIRFRSMPGTSREILSIFIAMTVGITLGMGYVYIAIITVILSSLITLLLCKTKTFENNTSKLLKITIPENLDYTDVFNEEFNEYLNSFELSQVKTTNMGSLFELTYVINTKNSINEKEFIDKLRIKNGNLKITISKPLEENIL